MEQLNKSIEEVLDNLDNNTVQKSRSSIAVPIVLMGAGVALVALNGQMPGASEGGILSPLLIVAGILLLAWGVIAVFFRKTKYRCAASRQCIAFHELLFDVKERDRLIRLVEEGHVNEIGKLKPSTSDALKLRVASTPDGTLCYSQVVTYIPFEFVNANEARRHSAAEGKALAELARKR